MAAHEQRDHDLLQHLLLTDDHAPHLLDDRRLDLAKSRDSLLQLLSFGLRWGQWRHVIFRSLPLIIPAAFSAPVEIPELIPGLAAVRLSPRCSSRRRDRPSPDCSERWRCPGASWRWRREIRLWPRRPCLRPAIDSPDAHAAPRPLDN